MWYSKPINLRVAGLSIVALGLVLLLVHWQSAAIADWQPPDYAVFEDNAVPNFSAGNSTLGFQAILALSQGTKWRVDGLRAAGRVSGINVQVPPQPGWSEDFIKAFEDFGPVEAHGAALAWLGHIDLLKFVIQSGWGSALIMEDDMDWDVAVRNQTTLIAEAVLKLTKSKRKVNAPYGLDWDIMWMGHCSDPPYHDQRDGPIIFFQDSTAIPLEKYRGLDPHIREVVKEGERSVHYSRNPVCTFSYAVSAVGARKLLQHASLGRGGAFDLMLMHACQDGVLKCISVNPEIFSPYNPAEGGASEVRAGDAGGVFNADVGKTMGQTNNILNSARCAGLFQSTCL